LCSHLVLFSTISSDRHVVLATGLDSVLLFGSGFSRMRGGVAVIAVVYTEDYGRESLGGLNGLK